MKNGKLLVVIPTYNEAENIESIIRKILEVDKSVDILVVDDDSPDGTPKIVEEISKSEPRVKLLLRKNKPKGLGRAYVDGFKWAIENNYSYVLEIDADFSHDPGEIPNFLKALEESDVVVGSRYLGGIRVLNWDLKRLLLSLFGSFYARVVTGLKLTDLTGGFNAYKTEVLEAINLDKIDSNGYSFQIELKFRSFVKGFKIKEIPIVFREREKGESKMNKNIIFEAALECIKLRVEKLLGRI